MIKTIIPFLFSILFISCTFNGEHQSLKSVINKRGKNEAVIVDLKLSCDKIFYSEEQNSEEQIIFQIAYNNPTDYTYILGDRDNEDNAPDPVVSWDAVPESKGFIFKSQENPGILLTHYQKKQCVTIKPNQKHFFYLYMFNRYNSKEFKKNESVQIHYNGAKKNLKEMYDNNSEKIVFIQNAGLVINIDLDKVKFVKVTENTALYEPKLDKL